MKSQFHSKFREDCDWPAWVTCPSWPPVTVGEDPTLSLARSVHMTFLDLGVDQLYSDHREWLAPPGKIRYGACASLSRGPLEWDREAEPRAGAEKLLMRYKTKSPMGPRLQLVFGRQSCFCWPQTRLRQGPCRGQQAGSGPSLFPGVWHSARPRVEALKRCLETELCISEGAAQRLHPWP